MVLSWFYNIKLILYIQLIKPQIISIPSVSERENFSAFCTHVDMPILHQTHQIKHLIQQPFSTLHFISTSICNVYAISSNECISNSVNIIYTDFHQYPTPFKKHQEISSTHSHIHMAWTREWFYQWINSNSR